MHCLFTSDGEHLVGPEAKHIDEFLPGLVPEEPAHVTWHVDLRNDRNVVALGKLDQPRHLDLGQVLFILPPG